MEPIKTEYKGIVFDSKSEAVFARAMDLGKDFHYEWIYHPKGLMHEWDFVVRATFNGMPLAPMTVPIRDYIFIEYKPKQPTITYLNNLRDKSKDIDGKHSAVIVYGNPWEPPKDNPFIYAVMPVIIKEDVCMHFTTENCVINTLFGIHGSLVNEAKEYRFDLQ
jgi:hypothetical protein